jgi:hypothetical protein
MRLNEIQNGAAARVRALPRPVTITCPFRKSYPRVASPRLFPPLKIGLRDGR